MAPSLSPKPEFPHKWGIHPHLVLTALPWWYEGGVARRGVWVQGGEHPHPQTSHFVPLVNTVLCSMLSWLCGVSSAHDGGRGREPAQTPSWIKNSSAPKNELDCLGLRALSHSGHTVALQPCWSGPTPPAVV